MKISRPKPKPGYKWEDNDAKQQALHRALLMTLRDHGIGMQDSEIYATVANILGVLTVAMLASGNFTQEQIAYILDMNLKSGGMTIRDFLDKLPTAGHA
jgi:hypothetical protein